MQKKVLILVLLLQMVFGVDIYAAEALENRTLLVQDLVQFLVRKSGSERELFKGFNFFGHSRIDHAQLIAFQLLNYGSVGALLFALCFGLSKFEKGKKVNNVVGGGLKHVVERVFCLDETLLEKARKRDKELYNQLGEEYNKLLKENVARQDYIRLVSPFTSTQVKIGLDFETKKRDNHIQNLKKQLSQHVAVNCILSGAWGVQLRYLNNNNQELGNEPLLTVEKRTLVPEQLVGLSDTVGITTENREEEYGATFDRCSTGYKLTGQVQEE